MSSDAERDRYHPSEDRSLSDAVLEAQKGGDVTKEEFVLDDDIDPDALDRLFREDASPSTRVEFDTDDVAVALYGDGGVDITVGPRDDE